LYFLYSGLVEALVEYCPLSWCVAQHDHQTGHHYHCCCTCVQAPQALEATAQRYIRPQLQSAFIELCRQPVSHYLRKFGFQSDLVMAMYATTDGYSGLNGGWDTPGTGANFLFHNMCRLPGSDGTWMVVEGGMGSVAQQLALIARKHGVQIMTGSPVQELIRDGVSAGVSGVVLKNGDAISATAVVVNADPFRMQKLMAGGSLGSDLDSKLQALRKDGTTMKVRLLGSVSWDG
jgi:phytoene dehydrogenase-like protein